MTLLRTENSTAYCRCKCGSEFTTELCMPDEQYFDALKNIADKLNCDACCDKIAEENARTQREALVGMRGESLEGIGIPRGLASLESPVFRDVAVWLWRNKDKNILLAGETGCGKTTSAAFVAKELFKEEKSVKYTTLRNLIAEWTEAKTSDNDSDIKFLNRVARLDVLIIDEVVGKRAERLSGSAQELMFELIDGAYNKSRNTKIWLLGNFYKNCIDSMFFDPEPVKRRLNESFEKVLAVNDNGKITLKELRA